MPYCVGVTGGIGSGKSRAAAMFVDLGASVVDTDDISHELTGRGGSAVPAIVARFGADVMAADGSLDRVTMRKMVFADPEMRKQLEDILHPCIRTEARRRVSQSTAAYVLLVVPLLLETGSYRDLIQRVLVIDCEESLQLSRAMQRSHLTEDAVRAIMAAQIPRQQRLAQADDIISNNGDLAHLHLQVTNLHHRYLKFAATGTGQV